VIKTNDPCKTAYNCDVRPCATASRQPTYIPRVPSVPSPFSQGACNCCTV